MSDALAELCDWFGVHAQYRGFEGQTVDVSRETRGAVLRALGPEARTEAEARAMLDQMRAEEAARPLPYEVIVEAGAFADLPLAHPAEWQVEAEGTGDTLATGRGDGRLSLPALPMGIHRLRLITGSQDHTTWILARPARAVRLEDHVPGARVWGVSTALYGLTDGDAAQIGSYDLLGRYAAAMARHGADFLGINPVHAMGQVRPGDVISPYSPSHRAFLNTWHCALECRPTGDGAELVDYPAALAANAEALSGQYARFRQLPETSDQKVDYRGFAARAGNALDEYALFEALTCAFGADWRNWPMAYRDHDAGALAAFESEHAEQIARIKWAQWQADTQLARAQAKACGAGMRLGLFLDLAVGPRLGGAETWAKGSPLVTGATLGAPPDPLGPEGQSWGLAPLSPVKSRATGYAGFAQLLRAVMRHAGMIRIDHVLGLMRSFWIPEGGAEGTYVSYPFEALLAVVAIESVRNDTIVVGEDLGLVPEGLREQLADSGIYGLDVLQYMRTPNGGPVDTARTRKMAVCAFATHDTPTVAGFFTAEDARLRHAAGSIDKDTLERIRADRDRARETLAATDPVTAIHRKLAQANAGMVAIQLDDIANRVSQQNLPGTVDSHPNWRLKAPFTIDGIAASESFARLARDMADHGRSNLQGLEDEHGLHDGPDLAL